MDGSVLGLLELLLVFGGLIAFCGWELYALRRYKKAERDKESSDRSGGSH